MERRDTKDSRCADHKDHSVGRREREIEGEQIGAGNAAFHLQATGKHEKDETEKKHPQEKGIGTMTSGNVAKRKKGERPRGLDTGRDLENRRAEEAKQHVQLWACRKMGMAYFIPSQTNRQVSQTQARRDLDMAAAGY